MGTFRKRVPFFLKTAIINNRNQDQRNRNKTNNPKPTKSLWHLTRKRHKIWNSNV